MGAAISFIENLIFDCLYDKINFKYKLGGVTKMLSYCKKCGRTLYSIFELITICDVCGSQTYEVPRKYIDNFRWRDSDGKQALIEELVKTSPEFDQYLFDHREEILAKRSAEFNAIMAHGKAVSEGRDKGNKYGVECPYCHATNVKKITITNRVVSTSIFGFASKKIAKQWHCNNCGSDF